ncbi:peroxiredoxin-like 2C [Saccostrea cucullata]|uniref:peroxiredoxin-like 2C n=1 Tax=Saccostrea cuccullata TaxID=36930 RepID=UPI002ED4EA00
MSKVEENEETQVTEEIDNLQMSRGEKPEPCDFKFNFTKAKEKFVLDEGGNKIKFGDIYKHQKTIVIFTRHFLCFVCKDYIEDLAKVPLEYLQEAGVRVVVIGPAPDKFISAFKKETGFMYTMYTDPDRELYKLLGMKSNPEYGKNTKNNKHLKHNMISGILSSTWRAMQSQEYQGDVRQQGAEYILGPGDEVHFMHLCECTTDQTPINDLLHLAGVKQVSFPKDRRVIDV